MQHHVLHWPLAHPEPCLPCCPSLLPCQLHVEHLRLAPGHPQPHLYVRLGRSGAEPLPCCLLLLLPLLLRRVQCCRFIPLPASMHRASFAGTTPSLPLLCPLSI